MRRIFAVVGMGIWMAGGVLMATASAGAEELPQGVTGQVVRLKGNFFPMAILPGEKPPADRGQREILRVPVHVFRGKVATFAKPDPKHEQLVAIAKPEEDGTFRVPLPPGEYTVVAEIEGKLYLSIVTFDAETKKAAWATVTVKPKEWTRFNIEDTSQAAF